MSRLIQTNYQITSEHYLPVIDWAAINASPPTCLILPKTKLPSADIAVITWTSAEWSALDHVFINSDKKRGPYAEEWRDSWVPLTLSGESTPLLYFQLVSVTTTANVDKKVLLVKSEVHLAHPPYILGVESLVNTIIEQSGVSTVISTGTAGGSSVNQPLGDVVLTCAAHIELEKTENTDHCDYNRQTFTGTDIFPQADIYSKVKDKLMLPLDTVWNNESINKSVKELNERASTSYTADDLVNAPLVPSNLKNNSIEFAGVQPLLTTDFYFIDSGSSASAYCFLEMDDAVIAHQCVQKKTAYGFIRNVSDPVVVTEDKEGKTIPAEVREDWSGIVYSLCGFYTTFNSALTCWAAITSFKD